MKGRRRKDKEIKQLYIRRICPLICEPDFGYDRHLKGGERPLPFLLATWGLGGRKFNGSNIR